LKKTNDGLQVPIALIAKTENKSATLILTARINIQHSIIHRVVHVISWRNYLYLSTERRYRHKCKTALTSTTLVWIKWMSIKKTLKVYKSSSEKRHPCPIKLSLMSRNNTTVTKIQIIRWLRFHLLPVTKATLREPIFFSRIKQSSDNHNANYPYHVLQISFNGQSFLILNSRRTVKLRWKSVNLVGS